MGTYTILLPDVGEGIAEAELTEWNVRVGDVVKEDDIIGAVMTDKAAVEVPSVVDGKVTWLAGEIGDVIAIGAPLIKLEVSGTGNDQQGDELGEDAQIDVIKKPMMIQKEKPTAAPSVRKRAKEADVNLADVEGTGREGRVTHDDLDKHLKLARKKDDEKPIKAPMRDVKHIKVTGMRRKIAEKMALSKSRIPHITIVEEVDMTALEELRQKLNDQYQGDRAKLTILPFVMRAVVEVVRDQPELNARYDDNEGVISQHEAVHIGIATQTPNGLTVPVVKHSEVATLWQNADQVTRLADAARDGSINRDDLMGSTITITSLGALGALASTPIINHPEVAIVGINRMAVRPLWDGQQFQPRKMMNISCSFDHRVVDGWDAAVFVKKLKDLLETPAMMFVEG